MWCVRCHHGSESWVPALRGKKATCPVCGHGSFQEATPFNKVREPKVRKTLPACKPNRKSAARLARRIADWEREEHKEEPSLPLYKPGSLKKVC